jgi:hypothetical protein
MSVSITGLSRNIQFIISGDTTLVPKYLSTIYTSSTQVGIVYYANGFGSSQEIIQFNYASVTSHTFSNSSQAAEYIQSLIDEDQQYINAYIYFSGITASGVTPSYVSNLSALTISASTFYSGSSNLQTIITSLIPSSLFSGTTLGGIKLIYPGDTNVANENYSIAFGSNNKVYNKYSTILNGKTNIINSISSNYYNTILGGKNQTTYSSKYSLIGFGARNYMFGYYSVILGGSDNRIYGGPDHAFLLGNNNKTNSTHSFIFGYTNLITGVTNSSILGGRNNKIFKNTYGNFSYNIVVNSLQSTILNSSFSNIASGSGNTISSSNYSSIINGQSNKSYSSFSSVINGRLNLSLIHI